MTTALKGNATEAAVLAALVSRGFDVLLPFGGGQPYDLVAHLRPDLFLRVQCKTARLANGCIAFNCRSTDHGQGRRPYAGLADVFGAFYPPTNSVYLVPVREIAGFGAWLRLDPPRNNQKQKIRFAADYEIDRWTVESLREVVAAEQAAA